MRGFMTDLLSDSHHIHISNWLIVREDYPIPMFLVGTYIPRMQITFTNNRYPPIQPDLPIGYLACCRDELCNHF